MQTLRIKALKLRVHLRHWFPANYSTHNVFFSATISIAFISWCCSARRRVLNEISGFGTLGSVVHSTDTDRQFVEVMKVRLDYNPQVSAHPKDTL